MSINELLNVIIEAVFSIKDKILLSETNQEKIVLITKTIKEKNIKNIVDSNNKLN